MKTAEQMIEIIKDTERHFYTDLNEMSHIFGNDDWSTNRARAKWMAIVDLMETLNITNND